MKLKKVEVDEVVERVINYVTMEVVTGSTSLENRRVKVIFMRGLWHEIIREEGHSSESHDLTTTFRFLTTDSFVEINDIYKMRFL